jgi:Spy/CpxP family protein refolding chaperone
MTTQDVRLIGLIGLIGAVAIGLIAASGVALEAQRGGGGRTGQAPSVDARSRMELLSDAFTLTGSQRDAIRNRLDAAHKAGAPIRADLGTARAALAAAAAKATGGSDIATAAGAYAAAATAMTELEMKTLAEILAIVTPDQKKQGTAAAFYLMRGIILDDRRWNEMPRGRLY